MHMHKWLYHYFSYYSENIMRKLWRLCVLH